MSIIINLGLIVSSNLLLNTMKNGIKEYNKQSKYYFEVSFESTYCEGFENFLCRVETSNSFLHCNSKNDLLDTKIKKDDNKLLQCTHQIEANSVTHSVVGRDGNPYQSVDILLIYEENLEKTKNNIDNITQYIKSSNILSTAKLFLLTSLNIDKVKLSNLITEKQIHSFYATENFNFKTLVEALRTIYNHGAWIDPIFSDKLITQMQTYTQTINCIDIAALDNKITEREKTIIQLIASGFENDQIAKKLNLSTSTVKTHLVRLLNKTRLPNRTSLAVWAIKKNLVQI